MQLLQTSRFWNSYRSNLGLTLTVTINHASILSDSKSSADFDPYMVLVLPARDPSQKGSKEKTFVAKRTLNPVWKQSFTFDDVKQSEKIRLELRSGSEVLLCSHETDIADFSTKRHVRLEGDKGVADVDLTVEVEPAILPEYQSEASLPEDVTSDTSVFREVAQEYLGIRQPAFFSVEGSTASFIVDCRPTRSTWGGQLSAASSRSGSLEEHGIRAKPTRSPGRES